MLPMPTRWQAVLKEAGVDVPPGALLNEFVRLQDATVTEYKKILTALHKADVAKTKHLQSVAGDVIPPSIVNLFKPTSSVQIQLAATADVDKTQSVIDASAALDAALKAAAVAHLKVMTTKLEAQCEFFRAAIAVPAHTTKLGENIRAFARGILIDAGESEEQDKYDILIDTLLNATSSDLKDLKVNFVTVLRNETKQREEQEAAVAIARAQADTMDATDTVRDLITAQLKEQLDVRFKALEKPSGGTQSKKSEKKDTKQTQKPSNNNNNQNNNHSSNVRKNSHRPDNRSDSRPQYRPEPQRQNYRRERSFERQEYPEDRHRYEERPYSAPPNRRPPPQQHDDRGNGGGRHERSNPKGHKGNGQRQ
ncbi:hypothetical protein C8F01DRAFT_671139 [Mycena amicta]|nr:hypothetical protein C8F01DRAFT_671139 [Mycena amicta]